MTGLALSIVLQASLLGAAPEPQSDSEYDAAYQQSQESGKPLVVLIGTDWCPGCQTMKGQIDELNRRGVLRRFAFARVNSDRESKLANRVMSGGTIPQLVLFHKTPTGWKRQQLTGAHSVETVEAFLEQGLASAQASTGSETTLK